MALLTLPWWPLSPWLSPAAAWFIFFNAVVGAIAVMSSSSSSSSSSSAQAEAAPSRPRLCRSGSSVLLDHLRSVSIFSVHPAAGGAIAGAALPFDDAGGGSDSSDSHCCYCCSRSRQAEGAHDTQTQLPRSPMLPVDEDAATGGGTATSAPVAKAKAEDDHGAPAPALAPADKDVEAQAQTKAEAVLQDDSIGLDEAYALAQRHRAAQPLAPPPAATTTPSSARRTKKKPVAEAGVRRRAQGCGAAAAAAAGEALLEGKAELNARADLFIRQFREDLKLQRLNSILRHTQALGSPTTAAR